MTNLSDRLFQPCPLCNADATISPGSTWPCGQCDGLRFVPTDVSLAKIRADVDWTLRIVADIADAADDADEIAKYLATPILVPELVDVAKEARLLARRLRALIHARDWRASAEKGGGG